MSNLAATAISETSCVEPFGGGSEFSDCDCFIGLVVAEVATATATVADDFASTLIIVAILVGIRIRFVRFRSVNPLDSSKSWHFDCLFQFSLPKWKKLKRQNSQLKNNSAFFIPRLQAEQ